MITPFPGQLQEGSLLLRWWYSSVMQDIDKYWSCFGIKTFLHNFYIGDFFRPHILSACCTTEILVVSALREDARTGRRSGTAPMRIARNARLRADLRSRTRRMANMLKQNNRKIVILHDENLFLYSWKIRSWTLKATFTCQSCTFLERVCRPL